MTRLVVCAVLVASSAALAAGDVDPATVNCKEYNSASHPGKVDIGETMFAALQGDSRWAKVSEDHMLVKVDDAAANIPKPESSTRYNNGRRLSHDRATYVSEQVSTAPLGRMFPLGEDRGRRSF